MNIKSHGRQNVRKSRYIKNGDKYTTLDISLKFGSLEKKEITSSDPKYYLRRPGKGLITSIGIKTSVRSKKRKKARYAITNVSMKYLSKIIKDFEKLPYEGYVQKRRKNEPTDSYFYLAIHISNCMMIYDAFNSCVDPVRTKMTGTKHITISHVFDLDESKSKGIIVDKNLSQVCSTYDSEP